MIIAAHRKIAFLLIFIVTAVPLVFSISVQTAFTIPKATLLWTLSLFALFFLIKDSEQFERKKNIIPIAVFVIAILISAIFSELIFKAAIGEKHKYEGLISFAAYMVIFFAASTVRFKLDKVIFWIAAASVPISIYGLLQYLGLDFYRWAMFYSGNRSASTLGQPLVLGAYLNLVIPLMMVYFFKKDRGQLFYLACTVLSIGCLITTFTRGSWLALLISAAFLSSRIKKVHINEKKLFYFIGSLILILLVIYGYSSLSKSSQSVAQRFYEILNAEVPAPRQLLWNGTMKMVYDKPAFGWGNDTFRTFYPKYRLKEAARVDPGWDDKVYPHNLALEYAYSNGIVGLTAILWILVFSFLYYRKRLLQLPAEERLVLDGIAASLIGYLVALQFGITAIGVMPLFWFLLGIIYNKSVFSDEKESAHQDLGETAEEEQTGNDSTERLRKIASYIILIILPFLFLPFIAEIYQGKAIRSKKISYLETAAKLNPYDEEYLNETARFYSNTDPQKATRIFSDSLKINRYSWWTYEKLIEFYISYSNQDKLITPLILPAILEAKKLNPYESKLVAFEIEYYFLQKDYNSIKKLSDEHLRTMQYSATAYVTLAEISMRYEDKTTARDYSIKALEKDPENQRAREIFTFTGNN